MHLKYTGGFKLKTKMCFFSIIIAFNDTKDAVPQNKQHAQTADLTSRVTKLEETISSMSKTQTPDACPDRCQKFTDLQAKVEEMARSLERQNMSLASTTETTLEAHQPQSSEMCRGVIQTLIDTQTRLGEMNKTIQSLQDERLQEAKVT